MTMEHSQLGISEVKCEEMRNAPDFSLISQAHMIEILCHNNAENQKGPVYFIQVTEQKDLHGICTPLWELCQRPGHS